MSEQTAVVKTTEEKVAEFVPFGSQDKVKLSIAIVKNLVAVKTKSNQTCSDQDAIKFIAMCQARRLNPFEGDAFLIGYDNKDGKPPSFSLITAHQAFLKRAELNPEYDGMKSGIIVRNEDGMMKDLEGDFYIEGQELLGGWATVYFKNRKQAMHKRVRLKRFQKAWGIWQDDPAGMICKCAEADALRSSFPTMLGGLYLREELKVEDPKVTSPMFTAPATEPSKPLFSKPAEVVAEPEPEKPKTTRKKPEPKQGSPLEDEKTSKVQAIRAYMDVDGVEEPELLGFLTGIGFLPENITSLEQMDLQSLNTIYSQFKDLVSKMKTA